MGNKSNKENVYRCHAKFIYNHGQKPTLTFVTPGCLSSVLYRFYPLLIVLDGALSNIMWVCDDICLPFIHLVMTCLVVNLLSLSDLQNNSAERFRLGNVAALWLGLMSAFALMLAFAYYVLTVYEDLKESEPPTLDDIVIVLESVLDKLQTLRSEVVGRAINIRRPVNFIRLIAIFTPVHYVLMKLVSIKTYVLWLTIIGMLYHSTWFQCTVKLLRRVSVARKAYYTIATLFEGHRMIRHSPLIDAEAAISNCNTTIYIPCSDSLRMLRGNRLQLQLQKLYPPHEPIREKTKDKMPSKDIAVIDFTIYENQRRWRDEGWLPKMLSYERPNFCMELGDQVIRCRSPWEFQEGLPDDWKWLDDCWRPVGWIYSDSEWVVTGEKDSLESCTRSKIWKRRAFKDQRS